MNTLISRTLAGLGAVLLFAGILVASLSASTDTAEATPDPYTVENCLNNVLVNVDGVSYPPAHLRSVDIPMGADIELEFLNSLPCAKLALYSAPSADFDPSETQNVG